MWIGAAQCGHELPGVGEKLYEGSTGSDWLCRKDA